MDDHVVLASVEYRWPIYSTVDAFFLLDEGRVFEEFISGFTLRDWHFSAGGGIRIWGQSGNVLNIVVAAGREGTRFHVELTEGF